VYKLNYTPITLEGVKLKKNYIRGYTKKERLNITALERFWPWLYLNSVGGEGLGNKV
jgi:hypothetical protein